VVFFQKWAGELEPEKGVGVVLQAGESITTWCYCACDGAAAGDLRF